MPARTARGTGRRAAAGRRPAGIPKASTGIVGLDAVTRGGLPRGRVTMIFGGPGSGKTVLSLQFLVNGARRSNENGIFLAFEEPPDQIVANAATFGWNVPELLRHNLFFVDGRIAPDTGQSGRFDLSATLAAISSKTRELGAKRIVFDGIDVLLGRLGDPRAEREEMLRIQAWTRAEGLTAVMTAKLEAGQPENQYPAFMIDCAFQLNRRHHAGVSERDLTFLKYRGSAFSENRVPFVIGPDGIEVAEDQSGEGPGAASEERVSTGVPRLDTMLDGGLLRGGYTLITGLPGTTKSTLCGAFVHAACERGERALYVSFDEPIGERVRNLRSVGIDLRGHIDPGRLRLLASPPLADSAEIQLMRIRAVIAEQRATFVVIDPISALETSSSPDVARGVQARFVYWAKTLGITLVNSCLTATNDPTIEATNLGASTLCDVWIQLGYAQAGGERNRSLVIVKARGTNHSNQLRELILSDKGVDLANVYELGGEVLMGTMRWEQENRLREQEQRLRGEVATRRAELEQAQAELKARLDSLRQELSAKDAELAALTRDETDRQDRGQRQRAALVVHRRGDLVTEKPADRNPRSAKLVRRRQGAAAP